MDNPTDGFHVEISFHMGMDWDNWSNQDFPTDYKADCPGGGINHQDWQYYLVESGTLTGFGAYEGTLLDLSHQPQNLYYGCQIGDGANNSNDNYGFSTWIRCIGTFNYLGNEMSFNGSGDLFGDLNCCPTGELVQQFTIYDSGCNTSEFQFTVRTSNEACEEEEPELEGQGTGSHSSVFGGSNVENLSNKVPVRVMSISPNPTDQATTVRFTADEAMRITLDLLDMSGSTHVNLYDGVILPNVIYTEEVDMTNLSDGMYQLRWSTPNGVMTRKVLLIE